MSIIAAKNTFDRASTRSIISSGLVMVGSIAPP
jgi:peroxiredoxin family protein